MSQIIKVRPKVKLKAMQVVKGTPSQDIVDFFGTENIHQYSILSNSIVVCLTSGVVFRFSYGDWVVQKLNRGYDHCENAYFEEHYEIIADEPTPTTINNITFNITNNSKDDFASEIMEVVRKYGVGK